MKFLTEWLHKKLNAGQDTAGDENGTDTATAQGQDTADSAADTDQDQDTAAGGQQPGQDTAGQEDTGTDTAAGDEEEQDDAAKGEADTAPEDGQDTAADEPQEPGQDTAGEESGTDTATDEGEETPAPAQNTAASADRTEFQRMVQAFGAEFAGVCFAKGMGYDAAMALHYEGVKAENAELRKRLAAVGSYGEEGPASNAQPADDGERDQFNRDCAANEERMSKGAAALAAHNRRALQQTK